MEVEFDVNINAKLLYDYLLHHTYSSFSGVLGTAVGALILVGFAVTGYVIYLIAGLVVLLYLPWSLFLRSRRQMLNTPAFRKPLHYRLTQEGVEISQGEAKEFQKWENMCKATSTGKSIILYTSPVNASIFPREDMQDKQAAVIEIISKHMPAKKVKIRS